MSDPLRSDQSRSDLSRSDLLRPNQRPAHSDNIVYLMGALLGLGSGVLDVKVGDLLLTAMLVLASTMLLGGLRPEKPWRWTLLVAVFVPIVQLLAYWFMTEKPYRAQIYESFLGFLTGIAGAYGGSVARKGWNQLFGR